MRPRSRRTLHEAVRSLIHGGDILSAHDCSDGGLAVCLAESCISQNLARGTPRLIGASIDLTTLRTDGVRLDALLFGETQNRVVVSTSPLNAGKICAQAKILGITAYPIGTVGGTSLTLKIADQQSSWATADLHDAWWNSIARAMEA